MVIVKFCLGCLVCPAIPGARQRDTSRQWDNSDELFFCDPPCIEVFDDLISQLDFFSIVSLRYFHVFKFYFLRR